MGRRAAGGGGELCGFTEKGLTPPVCEKEQLRSGRDSASSLLRASVFPDAEAERQCEFQEAALEVKSEGMGVGG